MQRPAGSVQDVGAQFPRRLFALGHPSQRSILLVPPVRPDETREMSQLQREHLAAGSQLGGLRMGQ